MQWCDTLLECIVPEAVATPSPPPPPLPPIFSPTPSPPPPPHAQSAPSPPPQTQSEPCARGMRTHSSYPVVPLSWFQKDAIMSSMTIDALCKEPFTERPKPETKRSTLTPGMAGAACDALWEPVWSVRLSQCRARQLHCAMGVVVLVQACGTTFQELSMDEALAGYDRAKRFTHNYSMHNTRTCYFI